MASNRILQTSREGRQPTGTPVDFFTPKNGVKIELIYVLFYSSGDYSEKVYRINSKCYFFHYIM